MDDDFVWIHDYHLLVLPSLLRKRFHRLRCGLFLHSPFPSSEIWRTFPKREELLRSLLNVDLIGVHFTYALLLFVAPQRAAVPSCGALRCSVLFCAVGSALSCN